MLTNDEMLALSKAMRAHRVAIDRGDMPQIERTFGDLIRWKVEQQEIIASEKSTKAEKPPTKKPAARKLTPIQQAAEDLSAGDKARIDELYFDQRKKHGEIAEALGIKRTVVSAWLAKLKKKPGK